jgi:hypothetical protein
MRALLRQDPYVDDDARRHVHDKFHLPASIGKVTMFARRRQALMHRKPERPDRVEIANLQLPFCVRDAQADFRIGCDCFDFQVRSRRSFDADAATHEFYVDYRGRLDFSLPTPALSECMVRSYRSQYECRKRAEH